MSLGARQSAVAEAEARLARSTERLRQSWSSLKQEGSAALTPGRVVVVGLLSGYFGGVLAAGREADDTRPPREHSDGYSLVLALIQLGGSVLPHLLPSLAPAFRAGVAAGGGKPPEAPPAAQSGGDA